MYKSDNFDNIDRSQSYIFKHFVEAKHLYCKICNNQTIIVMLSFVNHL